MVAPLHLGMPAAPKGLRGAAGEGEVQRKAEEPVGTWEPVLLLHVLAAAINST
jgi:hypothetical protein